MKDLKPFQLVSECDKCGTLGQHLRYYTCVDIHSPEYFKVECSYCGYMWREQVKQKDKEKD